MTGHQSVSRAILFPESCREPRGAGGSRVPLRASDARGGAAGRPLTRSWAIPWKDCSLDMVQSVQERLQEMIQAHKDSGEEEPLSLTKTAVKNVLEKLRRAGAPARGVRGEIRRSLWRRYGDQSREPGGSQASGETPDVTIQGEPLSGRSHRNQDHQRFQVYPHPGGRRRRGQRCGHSYQGGLILPGARPIKTPIVFGA